MPADTITRLRKLLEEATPGPWIRPDSRADVWTTRGRLVAETDRPETCDLLVAMRTALPALLDVVEAARRHIDSRGVVSILRTQDELAAAIKRLEAPNA